MKKQLLIFFSRVHNYTLALPSKLLSLPIVGSQIIKHSLSLYNYISKSSREFFIQNHNTSYKLIRIFITKILNLLINIYNSLEEINNYFMIRYFLRSILLVLIFHTQGLIIIIVKKYYFLLLYCL
uniref:Uncharacterized protein n=1 Tax=Amanita thiersii TaxID=235537 RepID=A0A5Q0N309_9AGAR|nr:hypothetical protein [Amanita thiersii]QFZ98731.1 hypothetical protein [Amanita thiersii]